MLAEFTPEADQTQEAGAQKQNAGAHRNRGDLGKKALASSLKENREER